MTDLNSDARFSKLPQHFIDEIAQHEPSGIMGEDTWHEVQFEMGGIICQCAVLNGTHVALPSSEISKFTGIRKVMERQT